jgi:hypothetical protein
MRIFYFCYSHDRPTGGQKQAYRHVDILNRNGFDAYALHMTPGFRLCWFENTTRTIDQQAFRQLHDPRTDVLVVPEDLGEAILRFPGRKVVFNQNLYFGFLAFGERAPLIYPYLCADVVAALVVSEHNADALRFAAPRLMVHQVRNGVDTRRFARRPLSQKKPRIACIAKAPAQLAVVFHVAQLRARQHLNALESFEWVFIKGKTEQEVADILADSLAFVFLGVEEGLPLMPLEAMACGCVVLAADAGPVREYLDRSCLFPVGDAPQLVGRLEAVAALYPDRLDQLDALVLQGLATVRRYGLEQEERSVLTAWRAILGT